MMARRLKRIGFHWRATFQHDNVRDWNEPNDNREWRNSKAPVDWPVKSVEWALPACRYGLSIGLEMALPPINPGVDVNQFQIAVDLGAGDLFEKGLGVNIHLYPFNRLIWKGKPYPFDDVHQHAEQLTEEEYAVREGRVLERLEAARVRKLEQST